MLRNGKDIAIGIVKSKVKKGRDNVNIADILEALGEQSVPSEASDLIRLYEEVNKLSSTLRVNEKKPSGGI